MGGCGGASGMSSRTRFETISLRGKTGTEKQRQYAQNLIDGMRETAEANGIAGFHEQEGTSIRRHVTSSDAEKVQQAYRIIKVIIDNQKTYGDVIGILKSQSILSYADTLENQAKRSGKSIKKYVDDFIEEARRRKR